MDERHISIEYIFGLLRRNLFGFVVCTCLCLEICIVALAYIPKRYKASAVLNIQSSYFKNPLVSNLISEINDPGELNAQRQSILRMSLSKDFLDSLGEKYKIFKYPADSELRAVEREFLLKRIEYFSLSSTTFQVSIGANDPKVAFDMTNDVLEQMTYTLIEERYETLVKARDAIQAQAQFLSRALKDGQSAGRSQYLESELGKINSNIAALRAKYTETHPDLQKLRAKASEVRSRMKSAPASRPSGDLPDAFSTPSAKAPIQEIFNDILKKLSNLNIVLEMEKDRENVSYLSIVEQPAIPVAPIFPNKRMTLAMGLVGGIVLGILQMLFFEFRRLTYLTPESVAHSMQVRFLGELPSLVRNEGLLLLESGAATKALPFPQAGKMAG